MTTNTLIKLGPVAILATIFTASQLLLVEASDREFGNVKQTFAFSQKATHRASEVQGHGRASNNIRFNVIDGEPLNSLK